MTVRLSDEGRIVLEGKCPIEDAEPLLQLLLADRTRSVDWRTCEFAHCALVQILFASGARMIGPPTGAFLSDHVDAALARTRH